MAENNNEQHYSNETQKKIGKTALERIFLDGEINSRDQEEINSLRDAEKKLLKDIAKEMLEKGYTIQNEKSFEVFQKMYEIAYEKTSGMSEWKKIEGSKIGQVTVPNEKNKNEDILNSIPKCNF